MAEQKPPLWRRVLAPTLQWAVTQITSNWTALVAVVSTSGLMTALAWMTDWTRALGPVGIGAVTLVTGAFIWCAVVWIQSQLAKIRERKAKTGALVDWQQRVDYVNPLAAEFHKARIKLNDLKNPVTGAITGKRFVDCELLGPANVVSKQSSMMFVNLMNCDTVVVRPAKDLHLFNVILLEDCQIINGSIMNCTLFIGRKEVKTFAEMGAGFVTLTGVPEIDTPRLSAPEPEKPQ